MVHDLLKPCLSSSFLFDFLEDAREFPWMMEDIRAEKNVGPWDDVGPALASDSAFTIDAVSMSPGFLRVLVLRTCLT